LLNRELSHFAESSKAGPQISRFLLNTYMVQEQEEVQINQKGGIPGIVKEEKEKEGEWNLRQWISIPTLPPPLAPSLFSLPLIPRPPSNEAEELIKEVRRLPPSSSSSIPPALVVSPFR
jgi:hypothetical protein